MKSEYSSDSRTNSVREHHRVSDVHRVETFHVEQTGISLVDRIRTELTLDHIDSNTSRVMIGPWHPFAQSAVIKDTDLGLPMKFADACVPRKTIPGIEPGPGGEMHAAARVAYNYVVFERTDGKKIMVGVLPDFLSTNKLFFSKGEGNSVQVTLEQETPGVFRRGTRAIDYIVLSGDRYVDLLEAYSQQLDNRNPAREQSRLDGAALACTWDWAGKYITRDAVVTEVAAIQKLHHILRQEPDHQPHDKIDGFVLDDGWQKGYEYNIGDVNRKKFPEGLAPIISAIGAADMEAGIWMAPFFKSRLSPLVREHSDYFVKTPRGDLAEFRVRQPIHEDDRMGRVAYSEYPLILDISVPAVQDGIISDVQSHYDAGVRIFKLDFLAAAFAYPLQNKDKTTVEYYRELFTRMREKFPEAKLIGCTLPFTESLGLFDAVRVSSDSIVPIKSAGTKHIWGRILSLLSLTDIAKKSNGVMYKDMVLKSAMRSTMMGKKTCAAVDGVHWDAAENPIDPTVFEQANALITQLNSKDAQVVHFIGGSIGHLSPESMKSFIPLLKRMQQKNEKKSLDIDEFQRMAEAFYKPPWILYALGTTT